MKNIICPVSTKRIDSFLSRLTVFINVAFMGIFLYTHEPLFMLIVTIDYFIRAALDNRLSPVRLLASGILKTVGGVGVSIDLAPKVFASRLGFLCAFSASVLVLLGFTTASLIVASMLMLLSFLDSVFNFCLGCVIYQYWVFPFFGEK